MKRAVEVEQRRGSAKLVKSCGVYSCKFTAGTTLYSAHAFGDAGDFMCEQRHLERIAKGIIRDATFPSVANRGRKTKVRFVIWGDKQWVKGEGISQYDGVFHGNHVHAACSFSTTTKPPCAA
jgi:hypothetical protein